MYKTVDKDAQLQFSFYVVSTVHVMSLKLYIITPTRAPVTNKRILVKYISYNRTRFGAVRHHHQAKA
jgi:hypothetical protein